MSSESVPYAAIQLFAEAIELGSLRAAAKESGVTPSAVSHRIATLEAWIGAPILDRSVRRPRPTALGRALLDGSAPAFERLDRVAMAVRRASHPGRVVISAPPAIAALRLHPIVSQIDEGLTIELRSANFNAPVEDDPVDLAVRFLHDGPSDMRLGAPGWSAVCAIDQWERIGCPHHVHDLKDVALLHEAVFNFWPDILSGRSKVTPPKFVPFGDALSVFSAVASGYGVALLPREITRLAVERGELVTFQGGNAEPEAAFYVIPTEIGKTRDTAIALQRRIIDSF
ncbi:LysR family transcriptional regulator [Roseobacter sp. EG26]|uniref:LysR family transcriptional regulator n=1 Tax=Roseobacter sp. EG26 TaxID=3412477 RepID=UPI003CE4992B